MITRGFRDQHVLEKKGAFNGVSGKMSSIELR